MVRPIGEIADQNCDARFCGGHSVGGEGIGAGHVIALAFGDQNGWVGGEAKSSSVLGSGRSSGFVYGWCFMKGGRKLCNGHLGNVCGLMEVSGRGGLGAREHGRGRKGLNQNGIGGARM